MAEQRETRALARRWPVLLALLLISVASAAIVLHLTARAIGTTADGANYIAAARGLLTGKGYVACSGTPLNLFPPLYSATLAVPGLVGVDPLVGARWLNALAVGLLVGLSGWLFLAYLRSTLLVLLATLAVALAWPIYVAAIFVYSEPLFTVLCLLFVLWLPRAVRAPSGASLAVLALLASLGWLQRYIGVALVATGALAYLLLSSAPLRRRLRYTVVFALLGGVAPALWLARNLARTGSLTGSRGGSFNNLGEIPAVIARWFDPWAGTATALLIAVIVIAVLLVAAYVGRYRRLGLTGWAAFLPVPVVFFLLVYLALFLPVVAFSPVTIDNRMLSPLYPFIICLLFVLLERLALAVDARVGRRLGAVAAIAVAALWLAFITPRLARELDLLPASDEWAGFSAAALRDAAPVQWVAANRPVEPVYSNWVFPICIHTGHDAHLFPRDSADDAADVLLASDSPALVLVVLDSSDRRYEMDFEVQELAAAFEIEPLLQTENDEEGVYRLTRRG